MKQLIPQSRIDEDFSEYLYKEAGMERYSEPMITKRIFNAGVQFTLNEIQPLMVEFAEWCCENYNLLQNGQWCSLNEIYDSCTYTTQQLLEEFINDKNK